MIPEYDLARLGWPNQIDRLTEMLDNVWQTLRLDRAGVGGRTERGT